MVNTTKTPRKHGTWWGQEWIVLVKVISSQNEHVSTNNYSRRSSLPYPKCLTVASLRFM